MRRSSVKRHPALPVALRLFGRVGTGASVRDAAREVGLCQRRLIEVFTAEVGLTPKQFCRILRFQRARTLAEPGTSAVDWAQLAVTCGYFDQSHFIHDFREFSGLRPSDFVQQTRGAGLLSNHVTLPETVNFFQYGAPLSPEQ